KKFKDKFPAVQSIISVDRATGQSRDTIIDRAGRADIISEYIFNITKKGKLQSELNGIKQETERRKAGGLAYARWSGTQASAPEHVPETKSLCLAYRTVRIVAEA
ncbi:MAG: hypothetical protein ACKO96_45495, partial [Flammeovirgaceae bacterium]